jgi:hypothetical protein
MDNPAKLAIYDTQDDEKQKHNTTCVGHHYKAYIPPPDFDLYVVEIRTKINVFFLSD